MNESAGERDSGETGKSLEEQLSDLIMDDEDFVKAERFIRQYRRKAGESLDPETLQGFEQQWSAQAFRDALRGNHKILSEAVWKLVNATDFWESWDSLRDSPIDIQDADLRSDEFERDEADLLSQRTDLADLEISLLLALMLPSRLASRGLWNLPRSEEARSATQDVAESLSHAESKNRSDWLRTLGRGLLILGGAVIAGVNALGAATGHVSHTETVSMYLGMNGITAGAFDKRISFAFPRTGKEDPSDS